jgi:hypothetical protein
MYDEPIGTRSAKTPISFLECAGKTALFRGLRVSPHSGWRDVSRLLKAATRRRTPKACVEAIDQEES